MFFSVVMPSLLADYKRAAKHRDQKIVRAVKSVLNQSFKDFELIIVADGCDKTVEIIKKNFSEYLKDKIKLFKIKKQSMWGGIARNVGIYKSTGEYICYLDNDDVFLEDHLQNLFNGITNHDWYWMDNMSYDKKNEVFGKFSANIEKRGRCGTANILHKRSMGVYWLNRSAYATDDWIFIQTLKSKSENFTKIEGGQYGICHVPFGLLDV